MTGRFGEKIYVNHAFKRAVWARGRVLGRRAVGNESAPAGGDQSAQSPLERDHPCGRNMYFGILGVGGYALQLRTFDVFFTMNLR